MNSEDTPNKTGINNSDIESFDGDRSLDSTDMELRNIKEKDAKNKKEIDDDDGDYRSDDGNASSVDDTNDDDSNDESSNTEEEESEEEDGMETTESTSLWYYVAPEIFVRNKGVDPLLG